jgi:3-deoxy-manno-octulosonate cytidylyltransferase (CMP-KDO synthetase)
MKTVVIIPSRLNSSRFPRKALFPILGKPMIQHVYERASLIPETNGVYVASDSDEIKDCVLGFGGEHIFTSSTHQTGTDRLAEDAEILELDGRDIVINVQGDQPALDPNHAKLLEYVLKERGANYEASTLAIKFTNADEVDSPNHVKVVTALDGRAIYFSRAKIPFARVGEVTYFRHIGVYAYLAGFLRHYVTLPQSILERAESLEQLRILEHGFSIKVQLVTGASPEVDVPEDVEKAESAIRAL